MTAEPEDVIDLEYEEYEEYEEYDLGSDFFFGFEYEKGFQGTNSAAAAEYFRRFWDDLRTYSDDEFERTYHDFTHRSGRGGREGHGGRERKNPKKARPADRGRRAAKAETHDAEKTRERPRATDDGSASARLARKWILEHVPPRPAMVRRETREVTLRLTKNDAFPSFPIVGQPPIDFVRKFEVEVKKERDGPFPRGTAEKHANIDAKAASRSRASKSSRREVFDASTGRASATVTVGGLEPGVRYRFRTRLGCGSEDDVTWGEPGVESAYATKSAPEKSGSSPKNNAAPGRARSSEQVDKPKREPGPYMKFCKAERPKIVAANPMFTFGEIAKELGAKWRAMSDAQKAKFTSPHASPSSASDCAFAKKKNAAPVSSRETALAAVAAAEEAERAAEAAKAEKKRAGRLAAMTPGERAADAAREEAEADAARAETEKQRARADARKEKKRLAAARAAEREREERARAAERERELADIYRAQFAADTAERDAHASYSESAREQARAARAAAFTAAAAAEDARAAAALKAARSADSVSEKAALGEEDCAAAARISAALAAADEAAKESRFAKWDALWDASTGVSSSEASVGRSPSHSPETKRPPVEAFETPVPAHELSAPFWSSATPPDEGASDLAFRTKPCRFFLSGKGCKLGDACRFAHDAAAASERAQREVSVPAADHSAPALRAGASEAGSSLSSAQRRARAYKTKPCRYWTQRGTCTRGDECGFIHEPSPSREKAYKTKPCRYWTQKGTCARGDACGFIHGDAPEYAGGVEPATPTAHFASHSATYCGVCRLPFVTEDELVEHLWSDAHRDRINVASEWHDGA